MQQFDFLCLRNPLPLSSWSNTAINVSIEREPLLQLGWGKLSRDVLGALLFSTNTHTLNSFFSRMSFWLEHGSIFSSGSCGHHIWRQSPTWTAHIYMPQIHIGWKDDLSVSTLYPQHTHTPLCGMKKWVAFVLHMARCKLGYSLSVFS